ncbi:hypothetical protein ACOSQ2_019039 [Xanthoceras sorbifolium]
MENHSGGLSIKVMKNLNQSLIAKSSWRLIHNNNSLGSEMIRCKYLKDRPKVDCLSDKCSSSCAWKVPNVGPLQTYALKELDQNQLSRKCVTSLLKSCGTTIFCALKYLWKWRCCKVFEENFCIPLDPSKVIMGALKEWIPSCKEEADIDRNCHQIAWQPSLNNWVKFNVDGSRRGADGVIAAGEVIRDLGKN